MSQDLAVYKDRITDYAMILMFGCVICGARSLVNTVSEILIGTAQSLRVYVYYLH